MLPGELHNLTKNVPKSFFKGLRAFFCKSKYFLFPWGIHTFKIEKQSTVLSKKVCKFLCSPSLLLG